MMVDNEIFRQLSEQQLSQNIKYWKDRAASWKKILQEQKRMQK